MTVAGVGGAIAHSCLGHPSRAVELTLRKYDIVDGLDTVGKRGVVGCDVCVMGKIRRGPVDGKRRARNSKLWLKLGRWAEWKEWIRGNGCTRIFLARCQRRFLAAGWRLRGGAWRGAGRQH